jgi:hypothetical protein
MGPAVADDSALFLVPVLVLLLVTDRRVSLHGASMSTCIQL